MSLLDRIKECNNAGNLGEYLAFFTGGIRVGWLNGKFASILAAYPEVFSFGPDGVSLVSELKTYEDRTRAVARVTRDLCAKGWFEGWRNEAYAVGTSFYGEPLFEIERAAVPRFGIRGYGIHVNGFIKKSGSVHLWIGQRAQDKATYPGKLDNMVAGGQPVGIGLRENVLKEAYEEASVPRSIANQAISVGAIKYCHGFSGGVKPDVMFVFDMEMPENFTPKNTDGEVQSFELLPAEEVLKICAETFDFKFNCSLVNIDFFIRHGILGPDHPEFLDIIAGLHN